MNAARGPVPVLIVGVGNTYRRDDGAGLAAAARLGALAQVPVVLHDGAGDAAALLDAWHGAGTVIVLDATRSGAPAGTVRRVDLRTAAGTQLRPEPRASSHVLGLGETIALGGAIGRLPRRLVVIGIEGVCFEYGVGLSPAVERAVAEAVQAGLREIADGRFEDVSRAAG